MKIWDIHGSWFAVTTNKGATRREYIADAGTNTIEIYDYRFPPDQAYSMRWYEEQETFLTEWCNIRLNEEVTCRTIYA